MPHTRLIKHTLEKAEELISNRRFSDAALALREIGELETRDPETLAALCATLMQLGMMPMAEERARQWERLEPENPMVHTTLGSLSLYHDGQWYGPGFDLEAALKHLDRALQLDEKNENAAKMAGLASFHHHNMELAGHYLRIAAEVDPMQSQHHYWLGRVAFNTGDLDGAVDALSRATRLNARHPQAWRFLGWVHYEMREWDKAIDAYTRAIEVTPSDPTPYLRLGLIYGVHQGDYAKGRRHFEDVLRQFPKWLPGYIGLADLYRSQQEYALAVEWYIKSLRIEPGAGYPLVMLYHLFRDIGEEEIVYQIAEFGVGCKPEGEYEEMDFLDRARFFAILEQPDKARALLRHFAARFPNSRAGGVLKDYRTLIDNPKALAQVDRSILEQIQSKQTPAEDDASTEEDEAESGDVRRPVHEYVLLRQFGWEPNCDDRERVRQLWNDFIQSPPDPEG